MKKQFVPYEIALELKNLNFDEVCFGTWDLWDSRKPPRLTTMFHPYCLGQEYAKRFDKSCIIAPLYQQVFRWFREKHNMWGFPLYTGFSIINPNLKRSKMIGMRIMKHCTYEEAELACIREMIKIVKNGK